jgi:hypothetical protein
MPVVSIFVGIVIRMFYREHGVAHFHGDYQGQQATFTFDGEVLAGAIRSRTALGPPQGRCAAREDRPAGVKETLMTFLPTVIRAEYRGEYRIHLAFNDGMERSLDFSSWLEGPIFEPLKDHGYFSAAFSRAAR